MHVVTSEKKPIKLWLDDIEDGAMLQARNLANLPFIHKHIAIMPDAHKGYGMPIGGVMATQGVIVPNAVGVDIGCGMRAVKTTYKHEDIDDAFIKEAMGKVRKEVPVGFSHHNENQDWCAFEGSSDRFNDAPDIPIIQQQLSSTRKQMGTLGGNNHFIEYQKGDDGYLWIMVHSGSRNFGYKIANEYHSKALKLCERWHSDIPNKELSFLPIESIEGKEYFEALNYALEFAYWNRARILGKAVHACGATIVDNKIDIHHNYAAWENHYNKNVIVHRKGATRAREGEIGIIPGSQGTKSYIVKGKGNLESFNSCSHGAGRKMGRKQATCELSLENEIAQMESKGIIHSIRTEKDLAEAAGAYKDIDVVMENQKDLVDIIVTLKPWGVIKG